MKLNPRAPVFKPRKCPYNLRSKGPPSPPPPSPRSLTPANSIISIKNEPGSSPKSDNGRISAYSPPLTDEIEGSETFLVPPMNQDLYSPPPTTPPYWYENVPSPVPSSTAATPTMASINDVGILIKQLLDEQRDELTRYFTARIDQVMFYCEALGNAFHRQEQYMVYKAQQNQYEVKCRMCRTGTANYVSISCGAGCPLCQFCSTRTDNGALRNSQCPCCQIPTAWVVIRRHDQSPGSSS